MGIRSKIKNFLTLPIKTHRDMGDKLRYILPIITLCKTSSKKNFIRNLVFTQTLIEILKKITRKRRPDDNTPYDKSDDLSFPSGHAGAGLLAGNYYYEYIFLYIL